MCSGPTFDRVYSALKERLVAGRFAPGDHLEPSALGAELFASLTPVRDALHRLVGERIVEAPRNDGFRVPAPTEAELRGLYGWRGLVLDLALRQASKLHRLPSSASLTPAGPEPAAEPGPGALFLHVARRSGLREIEAAAVNIGERLGPFVEAEGKLFAGIEDELAELWQICRSEDWRLLRRRLAAYHRRRQRAAPELLEWAWRTAHNRQI